MNKKYVSLIISAVVLIIIGVVVFALVKNDDKKLIVIFDNDGITERVEVSKNSVVDEPNEPTKEGYSFIGWYYNGEKFDFTTKITENITLKAKWEKLETFLVSFDSNGGTTVASLNILSGNKIENVPVTTRTGYTFLGWYYNGEKFDFNTKITSNISLKAKWKAISSTKTISYVVTFDSNGGSAVQSQTIESGQKAVSPEAPTRDGYTFVGWYYNDAVYDFNSKVVKNLTLIAKWQKNDVITYLIEETESFVGQVRIFVLKNGVKVDGKVDLTLNNNRVIKNKEISKNGYMTNVNKIKEIKNVRTK